MIIVVDLVYAVVQQRLLELTAIDSSRGLLDLDILQQPNHIRRQCDYICPSNFRTSLRKRHLAWGGEASTLLQLLLENPTRGRHRLCESEPSNQFRVKCKNKNIDVEANVESLVGTVPEVRHNLLHLEIPKKPSRRYSSIALFVCDHLCFHKPSHKTNAFGGQCAVQKRCYAFFCNSFHYERCRGCR